MRNRSKDLMKPVRRRRPTPPGEILREFYLVPREIPIAKLARALQMSREHVSQVINGHRRIEAPLAIKLAKALDTTPELWLNLQKAVDLWDAAADLKGWRPGEKLPAAPEAA